MLSFECSTSDTESRSDKETKPEDRTATVEDWGKHHGMLRSAEAQHQKP